MSFASLKKKSGSFDKLTQQIEKMSKPQGAGPDERLWKPGVDKSGNGYAVIRFLPEPEGEDLPWAQVWSHAFQGPGGWYIENSLTTLGQKDPVGELNRTLWNSGLDSDKEIARKQKRKLSYYSNIYVVKDQLNPQNEGKVFLYKYGKKIHDKIVSSMQPQFEDEELSTPLISGLVRTSVSRSKPLVVTGIMISLISQHLARWVVSMMRNWKHCGSLSIPSRNSLTLLPSSLMRNWKSV